MSARIETIPQDLATLCERCKVIKFTDEHLWIEESDGSLRNDPGLVAWQLQYELDDEFPDFPILTQSAQECDFCRQLLQGFLDAKQALQHIRGSNVPFDVRFSLLYYLENEGDEKDEEYEELKGRGERDSDEEYEKGSRLIKGLYGIRAVLHAKDDLESVDGLSSIIYIAESSSVQHDTTSKWLRLRLVAFKSALDKEPLNWMLSKLDDCDSHNHHPAGRGFCPKRLVKTSDDKCRLVEFSTRSRNGSTPKYAALSYCWGTNSEAASQLKTESASLSQRLAGIQDGEWTPVLRDAVRVTRSLGIPYLWIDALCIMQGTDGDWEEQCAQMDQIYGGAYVTFCALSSRSCQEGFLQQTTPALKIPFQSHINPSVNGSFRLRRAYTMISRNSFIPFEHIFLDDDDSEWGSRGWTFQEQFLSTRILYFGKATIHFYCPTLWHSYGRQATSVRQYGNVADINDPGGLLMNWPTVMTHFSHRLLPRADLSRGPFTVRTDILPSLSGIAAIFSTKADGDRYVAGMWEKSLWLHLPWVLRTRETSQSRTLQEHLQDLSNVSPYIVPSWSWLCQASIDTLISHSNYSGLYPEGQVTASVVLKGANPFGEIQSGLLTVTSHTHAVDFDPVKVSREGIRTELWRVFVDGEYLTDCNLDWTPASNTALSGHRLKLVLLGSVLDKRRNRVASARNCSDVLKTEELPNPMKLRGRIGTCVCQDCSRRDAFGIVIAKWPPVTGKNYRVGSFTSEQEGSRGLGFWRQRCPVETVEIV